MMVRICLLPEVEVSHSVTKSMAILSNGHSGPFPGPTKKLHGDSTLLYLIVTLDISKWSMLELLYVCNLSILFMYLLKSVIWVFGVEFLFC